MSDYIFRIDGALYKEETGETVMKPKLIGELIRCKNCKHRDDDVHWPWCPLLYIDDGNYCSYGDPKEADDI